MLLLVLSILSLPTAAVPLSTVEGRVTMGGNPLPGCEVRLESPGWSRTEVSDEEGRYRFAGVAEGEYEIRFELEFTEDPDPQSVLVRGELTTVPAHDLRLVVTETIVFACGSACSDSDSQRDFFVDQLTLFQSEHADAVAMKFLEDEEGLARYQEFRAAAVLAEAH